MDDRTDIASRLARGLRALGLDAAIGAPLLRYLDLLLTWNRAYNLTAVRDPLQMVDKHLIDSLTLVDHVAAVAPDARVADIGTGPGLPGIPLAIALPRLRVALVESNGKKARFLREAVRALDLADRVRVLEARSETVAEPGAFDCLTARAFGTLAGILAAGGHLLRPGGRLLAMKGQFPADEIAELPASYRLAATVALTVPGLDAERHLVVVEKPPGKTG